MPAPPPLGRCKEETWQLFVEEGQSLEDVAAARGTKVSTALSYLLDARANGLPLPLERLPFLEKEDAGLVRAALEELRRDDDAARQQTLDSEVEDQNVEDADDTTGNAGGDAVGDGSGVAASPGMASRQQHRQASARRKRPRTARPRRRYVDWDRAMLRRLKERLPIDFPYNDMKLQVAREDEREQLTDMSANADSTDLTEKGRSDGVQVQRGLADQGGASGTADAGTAAQQPRGAGKRRRAAVQELTESEGSLAAAAQVILLAA